MWIALLLFFLIIGGIWTFGSPYVTPKIPSSISSNKWAMLVVTGILLYVTFWLGTGIVKFVTHREV